VSGRARALAVVAVDLALLVTAVVFLALPDGGEARSEEWASNGVGGFVSLALPALVFAAVGALITIRRSGHRIGWLLAAIGMLWMVVLASSAVGYWAEGQGMEGGAPAWIAWLGNAWVLAVGLMGTHLPLRLPDGRLPSPRWRGYSRLCTLVLALTVVLISTDASTADNPAAIDLPDWVGALFVLFPLSFLGALASVVLRYRRTRDPRPRAQIRWIAFGVAIFIGTYAISSVLLLLVVADDSLVADALIYADQLAYAAVPVAIGIAVLRHRLYDIDRIINRTLVYGSVTAVLAAGYVGLVLLLRSALGPLTDGNGLAVALSTLAVASLFRPARRRAQTLIDRRFDRRKYDAARTLERFGARLRSETDLEALRAELTAVVRDTMQPAHVSLWLRADPPSRFS
jgi:hypothetical protein